MKVWERHSRTVNNHDGGLGSGSLISHSHSQRRRRCCRRRGRPWRTDHLRSISSLISRSLSLFYSLFIQSPTFYLFLNATYSNPPLYTLSIPSTISKQSHQKMASSSSRSTHNALRTSSSYGNIHTAAISTALGGGISSSAAPRDNRRERRAQTASGTTPSAFSTSSGISKPYSTLSCNFYWAINFSIGHDVHIFYYKITLYYGGKMYKTAILNGIWYHYQLEYQAPLH